MLRAAYILLFTLQSLSLKAQKDSVVDQNPICADLDIKGNIYFIDSSYQICKQTKGVVTQRFSLTNYGEGPILDASNPLEVFVFYENSGIVLILDNNLNPVQEVNLYANSNIRVQAFGRANDGKIWVFDANSYTIKKYDRTSALVAESVMLNKGSEQSTKGINRIFDNGSVVAFQQAKRFTIVLNNNLKVLSNKEDNYMLVGLDGSAILEQDNQTLVKKVHSPTGREVKSVLAEKVRGEIICAVQGKMLVKSAQKLKLESY